MTDKTICIAGKGRIAIETLRLVVDRYSHSHNIVGICNASDDGVDQWQPSFRSFLKGTHCTPSVSLKEAQGFDNLVFISVEFDRILSPEKFRQGSRLFNLHFSLLPLYKGMYTSCLPILHGLGQTGCTLHEIDKGIDTGDIITQSVVYINEDDTAKVLYGKYIEAGISIIYQQVSNLVNGHYKSEPQTSAGSSYYSKRSIDYSEVTIDLVNTAFQIKRQINAFTHRSYQIPRCFGLPISYVSILPTRSVCKPGTVLEHTDEHIVVSSIDFDCLLLIDKFDDLINAAKMDDIGIAEKVMSKSFYLLEETSREGWTALMVAAYHGSLSVMNLLIQFGADVNRTNNKGTTPLMYAKDRYINSGDIGAYELLISAGAQTDLRDIFGKSLFEYVSLHDRLRFEEINNKRG